MRRVSLPHLIIFSATIAICLQFALVGTARADDCMRYIQNPVNLITVPKGLIEDCQRTPGAQALLTALASSLAGSAAGATVATILGQMAAQGASTTLAGQTGGQTLTGSVSPQTAPTSPGGPPTGPGPGASPPVPPGAGTTGATGTAPPGPSSTPPGSTETNTGLYSGNTAIGILVQNGLLQPDPRGGYMPTPALTNWLNNPLAPNPSLNTSRVVGSAGIDGGPQTHTETIDIKSLTGIAISNDPTKPIQPGDVAITVNQTDPSGLKPVPPGPPTELGTLTTPGSTSVPPMSVPPSTGGAPTGGSPSGGIPPPGGTPSTGGTPVGGGGPSGGSTTGGTPPNVGPVSPPPPPSGGAPAGGTPPQSPSSSGQTPPTAPQGPISIKETVKNIVDQIKQAADPTKFIDDQLKELQKGSDLYQKAAEKEKADAEKSKGSGDSLAGLLGEIEKGIKDGKSLEDAATEVGAKTAGTKFIVDEAAQRTGLPPDVVQALLQVDPKTWQSLRDMLPKPAQPPGPPKVLPK